MEIRGLRPCAGEPVGARSGRQLPADHEAEVTRPGRSNESRVEGFRHLLDHALRILTLLRQRAPKLPRQGDVIGEGADVALPEAGEVLEPELRSAAHGSLARVHQATVALGARSCSPTSLARRSATVHQSKDSVTSDALTMSSRSLGM